MPNSPASRIPSNLRNKVYKPTFNMKRPVLVFRHFGNKGYSLFACLGREVVCSVLSVATLTYASAESVSTDPVVTDSTATTTATEEMLEEVCVTGSKEGLIPVHHPDIWRRKWQLTAVFLPWELPWTEGPGRLRSMGMQRVGHN